MESADRAKQIVEMAKTMTVKQIAAELSVSESLVRYHASGGKNGKYRKKSVAKSEHSQIKKKDSFPSDFKARRLSLSECFSLMDIPEAYEPVATTVSRAKGHQIAGNAIVKNCLVAVVGQMFEGHENDYAHLHTDVLERK